MKKPMSLMWIRKIFVLLALSLPAALFAQRNGAYEAYIERYKDMAVEQMHRHRIPASITLAQALLESGAGRSRLAVEANNHFGIKCGGRWDGRYILENDDALGEKFRVYNSPRESYEDHSLFLKKPRYAALFSLKLTDYKGWAHGLKSAGYATNPRYAQLLIKIIEEYDLTKYDGVGRHWRKTTDGESRVGGYQVRRCNQSLYLIARSGDTFASIGKQMGISARKLRRYNEVGRDYVLSAGDVVYLEKKRSKADRSFKGKWHTVADGQSLYTIAQLYGVRLKTLYKLNGLPDTYRAEVGDRIRIR